MTNSIARPGSFPCAEARDGAGFGRPASEHTRMTSVAVTTSRRLVLFRTSIGGAMERGCRGAGAVPTAMVPEAYTLRRVDSNACVALRYLAGTRPWCAFSDRVGDEHADRSAASHEGTKLQAIIDACTAGALAAKVVTVISNNRDAGALRRARAARHQGPPSVQPHALGG